MNPTENFNAASKLVKEGRFEEALKIPLVPSDKSVIEKRIEEKKAKS